MTGPNRIWISETEYVNVSAAPLSAEIATKMRSHDFYSMLTYLPNPDKVLRTKGQTIEIYRELAYDSEVDAARDKRKAPTLRLKWDLDRDQAQSNTTQYWRDVFAKYNMYEFHSTILEAEPYGYQPMEIIWSDTSDYVFPIQVKDKPQEWFGFEPVTNKLLFRSKANIYGEPVPDRKFLLPRRRATEKNPFGEGILSRVFWPVTFKRGGYRFWSRFVEKYGMPWIKFGYPAGTKVEDVWANVEVLEEMIQDAIVALPSTYTTDVIQTGGQSSPEIFDRFLANCDKQINVAFLWHAAGMESTPGKLGNEDNASESREDYGQAQREMLVATVQELINIGHELNFGPEYGPPPKYSVYAEEDVDADQADRDTQLHGIGVRFNKIYFVRNYGLKEDEFEMDTGSSGGDGTDIGDQPEGVSGLGEQSVEPQPLPSSVDNRPLEERLADLENVLANRGSTPKSTPDFANRAPNDVPVDQQIIDRMLNRITDTGLQNQMTEIIKPIIELMQTSNGYDVALNYLSHFFPEMDTKELQANLAYMLFHSHLIGRLSAYGEDS